MVIIIILLLLLLLFVNSKIFTEYFSDKIFKAPASLTVLKSISETSVPDSNLYNTLKNIVSKNTSSYRGNTLSFPSFFHVVEKWPGCLPRPLYQGTCGSCWGFAIATALSSRFYIESCGISGCLNYPQINFGSLNNVNNNLNETYKFQKLYLTNVFKYIDVNRNKKISENEWLEVIMKYFVIFNNIGTPFIEKHYIVQVLTYILDFQSMGSIDLTDEKAVEERAKETFPIWKEYIKNSGMMIENFDLVDDLSNESKEIDIKLLEERWNSEPIALSAEKIIACCTKCIEKDNSNLMCGGGSLTDGWSLTRESGTPTAQCIGYNMDTYLNGDTSNCKAVQGPYYSFCSGYSIVDEDIDLDEVIQSFEDSDINPLAIPHNESNLPWIDPQLFIFRAKNVYEISNNMHAIMREIIERGPVTTGFTIYPDFQYSFGSEGMGGQKYKINTNPIGSSKNSLIYKWDGKGNSLGGHAITIVGWGTFIDASKSIKIPYWICLNSWGVKWGHSGYPSFGDKTSLPTNLNMGGYFWILRGLNMCGIEENVVAGQPDIENITYPGIIEQYGWGLPPPDEDEVHYVTQIDKIKSKDNSFVFNSAKEGGGTYTKLNGVNNIVNFDFSTISTNNLNDSTNQATSTPVWSVNSMDPPSPFVLFWSKERPVYCLGLINEQLDSLTNDDVIIVDKIVVTTMKKIEKILKNPLMTIGDEQMQFISYLEPVDTDSELIYGLKVFRAVNNSNITKHLKNSIIKIIPYKELGLDKISKILEICPLDL